MAWFPYEDKPGFRFAEPGHSFLACLMSECLAEIWRFHFYFGLQGIGLEEYKVDV